MATRQVGPAETAPSEVFDVAAHCQALRTIREAGLDGCEFSHYQHLAPADQEKLREVCSCMCLAIGIMGERLVTTHLQDNFGERDDHLPPGQGSIAWEAVHSLTKITRST